MERDLSSTGQRLSQGQVCGLPALRAAGGCLLLDRDSRELELLSRQFDHRLKGGLRFAGSHGASLFVPLRPDVEMPSSWQVGYVTGLMWSYPLRPLM